MDGKNTPFEEWLDSTKLTEYKEVFISNGFDDLDLLREMDDGEIASMIQTLEMKKEGHIMKLKKCLAGLKAPVKKKECDAPVERLTEVKQSVLTFSKGKLALKSDSNVASKNPWDSFLKTNSKTEKMRFFNQVTQEIYESAFIHKQTQFRSYLNGERQFRWEFSQQKENLTDISGYYEQGLIIKENIKFKRYLTLPSDPTLKDASQAGRALQHVQSARLKLMKFKRSSGTEILSYMTEIIR